MYSILIIEDNTNQVTAVTDRLEAEGYKVASAKNGVSGLSELNKNIYDLALVDIMLPGKSGFDIVSEYRHNNGGTPVIFLTAKSGIADKVSGLRIGADDYLTKPFDFSELLARMENCLRRSSSAKNASLQNTKDNTNELAINNKHGDILESMCLEQGRDDYFFGPFCISFKKMNLYKSGKPVSMPMMEFRLLVWLVLHRDELVRTETLMDCVWGYGSDIAPGTVYTHVSWLRKKLKTAEMPGGYIRTVRNVGYVFSEMHEE